MRATPPQTAGQPRVHRPLPTASWPISQSWGPSITDSTDWSVSRSAGNLTIRRGKESITVPEDLVPWFADAVAQAAVWTDDQP